MPERGEAGTSRDEVCLVSSTMSYIFSSALVGRLNAGVFSTMISISVSLVGYPSLIQQPMRSTRTLLSLYVPAVSMGFWVATKAKLSWAFTMPRGNRW